MERHRVRSCQAPKMPRVRGCESEVLKPLYPPLKWFSSPPLVAVVLIAPKFAESPASGRMGVMGALVLFFSI